MHSAAALDYSRIAQDLQIRKVQVESVVGLLDEGNTVPFITRYRKERTGGLNEDILRQIQARVAHQRQLAERKQTILKTIEAQGRLSDELRAAILAADTAKRLEDLYLPYKPKKRTLATAARDRGLGPLAEAIWQRDPAAANLTELLPSLVNPEKELKTPEEVLLGVQHILAEQIAETAEVRAAVRRVLWETGKITSAKSEKAAPEQGEEYKDYFQFGESLRQIPPHRILALNRGEKASVLKVGMQWHVEGGNQAALHALAEHLLVEEEKRKGQPVVTSQTEGVTAEAAAPAPTLPSEPGGEPLSPAVSYQTPHAAFLRQVAEDALARLLLPSLEREIRRELTEEAEAHAVTVFARNLRRLLLQRPLWNRRVLAIDPGFRTGCKLAALDEHGNLLEHGVIFPHGGRKPAVPQPPTPTPPPIAEAPPTPGLAAEGPAVVQAATEPTPAASPAAASTASPPTVAAEPAASVEPTPVPPPAAVAAPTPSPAEAVPTQAATSESPPPAAPVAGAPSQAEQQAKSASQAAARREEARTKLHDLISRHNLNIVAIGNGTGCRETEELVAELIAEKLPELAYVIVNEAGASVYSASPVGREEFPDFDATLRGTISIGRRLQDPLSELVKIDPPSIGVGLYQHDVNPRHLRESLEAVVESCVNQVGVDLNTASVPLLRHVAGLNQVVARELVEHRQKNGPFRSREALLQVPGIGPARYVQAAGFLKIAGGDEPLDQTWIHPESYGASRRLLAELGLGPDTIQEISRRDDVLTRLKALAPEEVARQLEIGVPTVRDILESLARPGRDPREDLPPPIFKKGILKLEDLQAGMELKGTVLNVVDFGAFVDIGLKDSGLVHISQMANRYIKSPYDVVAVGDVVTVWVLSVDQGRRRVSLTMIKPGTERKPSERRPAERARAPEQGQAQGRPARGPRRPPRPEGQGGQRGPRPAHQRGGPRREAAPAQAAAAAGTEPAQQAPPPGEAAPARPAPQPRSAPPRRHREAPRPKLSQAALEGKVPLRTFGELSALFAAKKEPAKEASPPVAVEAVAAPPEPVAEDKPAEQPAEGATAPPA
jgi:uncharacterized protein